MERVEGRRDQLNRWNNYTPEQKRAFIEQNGLAATMQMLTGGKKDDNA